MWFRDLDGTYVRDVCDIDGVRVGHHVYNDNGNRGDVFTIVLYTDIFDVRPYQLRYSNELLRDEDYTKLIELMQDLSE